MNIAEVRRAINGELLVKIKRLGRPDLPYVGKLTKELGDEIFYFKGQSENEVLIGRVKLQEVSFVPRKEKYNE